MTHPIAYLNGEWIPADRASVPLWDAGFVLGATVSEQLRTFAGKLFRGDEHFHRMKRSLDIVGLELPISWDELAELSDQIIAHNWPLNSPDSDLGLAILATPGPYPTLAPPHLPSRPTLYLHTYELPFANWASLYARGQALAISKVTQVPDSCWPAELKCRSRMHYYLADRDVAARFAGARALLVNQHGMVTETSTANVLASFDGASLVTPPRAEILHGVTLEVVEHLAHSLGIPVSERAFTPDELRGANEILTTSTPSCLLSVTQLDGQPIGDGRPGLLYQRLLAAFRVFVGLDYVEQATIMAARGRAT